MRLNLENKEGAIYIGFNELGSYLFWNKTITSTWFCCFGTLAKFLCTTESNEIGIRQTKAIQQNLYNNFSNNLNELKELLNPILAKLKSGIYNLGFVEGDKWEISPNERKPTWNIYLQSENYRSSGNTNIAYNYYDSLDYRFIGTETKKSINDKTVKIYESEIKRGKRPFAIIMSSFYQPETDKSYPYDELGLYDADWNSEKFILDGHHKLIAYKNLGLEPNFAIIHQSIENMTNTYFDYNEFSSILNNDQKKHFLKNWESKDKYSNGMRTIY